MNTLAVVSAIRSYQKIRPDIEGLRRHGAVRSDVHNARTQRPADIPMQHSGSSSRRHVIKVEEIANYQRGLVDNVSGKDIDHEA